MRTEVAHSRQPAAHSRPAEARPGILSAVGRRLSALFGMPDYQRYVTHQHRCHPEATVLSEKEFVRSELERKYAGGGARCC